MKEMTMTTAGRYRLKAAEAARFAKLSEPGSDRRNFVQSERSYTTLAENEEWLATNGDKLVPATGKD